MLHDRDTLSHAEKRDGSDQWVVRAGSSKRGEARAACSAHVQHSLAKVVADRVQDDDCGEGPIRHLHGRPGGRAGPGRHRWHAGSAALVRQVGYPACTPCGAACVPSLGTLYRSKDGASDKQLVDSGTPHQVRRATHT